VARASVLSRPKYLHTVKCAIGVEEWGIAKRTSLLNAYFRHANDGSNFSSMVRTNHSRRNSLNRGVRRWGFTPRTSGGVSITSGPASNRGGISGTSISVLRLNTPWIRQGAVFPSRFEEARRRPGTAKRKEKEKKFSENRLRKRFSNDYFIPQPAPGEHRYLEMLPPRSWFPLK
jgi:hypothetical protein